jgi:hypothetical protein
MTLIRPLNENFHTIDKNGILTRISEMPNGAEWFDLIDKIDKVLECAHQEKNIIFLFRGESKALFWTKSGTELDQTEDPYYDRFFVIGSKAKAYLKEKDSEFIELRQFGGDAKTEYIFNALNRLSEKDEYKDILAYFNDVTRVEDFRAKMREIDVHEHRLTIENFFLAFIHTLSSDPEDINAHSVLISSSRRFEIARAFSHEGYIIAFWLRNPIQQQAIDYYNIQEYSRLLVSKGFPFIDTVNFPDESEVTIFSAIFPHNIFYVYDVSKEIFVFNPYILETDPQEVVARGINIDQGEFDEKLQGIYARSIWRANGRLLYEKEA